jgi:PBSX family phage portal protein
MKKKLLKRDVSSKPISRSKKFNVEDVHGNKHILKATIVTVKKQQASNALDENTLLPSAFTENVVKPPLSQYELSILQEYSSDLGTDIETLAVGIDGFGGRCIKREMTEAQEKKNKEKISEEKQWLDSLFMIPNIKESFTKLRKNTRHDLEQVGNAYWELLKDTVSGNRYTSINKLDVDITYLTKADKKFTKATVKYIDENLKQRTKQFMVKFRRVVQISGTKRVYFKEFNDPRIIDKRNGEVIAESIEEFRKLPKEKREKKGRKYWANEVYHFRIDTPRRTPYGMPRYTGNIINIRGSRGAEETNILTQQNNHVPSMAITVSGGMLTEGSIERIQEFVDTQIKGDSNYSKFLIIEGEGSHDALSGVSNVKFEVQPLSEAQHSDQLWQAYEQNNTAKLRKSWRMPALMTGETENLSREIAQESERMAEKYVFNPEREEFDVCINRIIMQQGFRFWTYKSNSPNVTNDQDLVRILSSGEKTGGVTPRIARMLLEDILNRDLPPIKEDDPDFDPDTPFSLSLAKLMHGAGTANQEGTLSSQGQTPKEPPGESNNKLDPVQKLFDDVDPDKIIKDLSGDPDNAISKLITIRDALEDFRNQEDES